MLAFGFIVIPFQQGDWGLAGLIHFPKVTSQSENELELSPQALESEIMEF